MSTPTLQQVLAAVSHSMELREDPKKPNRFAYNILHEMTGCTTDVARRTLSFYGLTDDIVYVAPDVYRVP